MAAAFDPRDPDFVRDPYPTYAALRRDDPLHRAPFGYFVLTRYADVAAALRDPAFRNGPSRHAVVNERNRGRYVCADVAANVLPFLDPPRHTRLRKEIGRAFQAHLARHPPDLRALAEERLRPLLERGELDLVGDFATPFSVAVIGRVLGVPEEDAPRLEAWSEAFFYLFAPIPSEEVLARVDRELAAFRGYFASLLEERRRAPRADLISVLARADGLGDAEVADTCMLLFADGVENVDRGIANAVLALLEHEDELRRLRADPRLDEPAVHELLRYDSPAQFIGRIAREELRLHGATIRAEQPVFLVLASANRDAERFEDPDALHLDRADNPHLAFGQGRHGCLGGGLVAAEMRAAIRAILENLDELRLAGPLRWVARPGHRWLEALPVRFAPSCGKMGPS